MEPVIPGLQADLCEFLICINALLGFGASVKVGSESPCRAELPTHIIYFSISSSVEIF